MASSITDNMHDLVKHFQSEESYHDFEGMADPRPVLQLCRVPDHTHYIWDLPTIIEPEKVKLARSLLLAHLYERADSYGVHDLTHDHIILLWEALEGWLSSRWWSIVQDSHIKDLEQTTDGE